MSNITGRYNRLVPLFVLAIVFILGAAVWFMCGNLLDLAAQRIWMGKEVFQEVSFDKKKWLEYKRYKPVNIRKKMFHDLKEHHLKLGMSRNEVIELLGKPEFTRNRTFYYYLGPDSANSDTNELVIKFSRDWKVSKLGWNET